jgi:hypothetical protein
MGTQLTRLDFNLALGHSTVKQYFFTEENGESLVCMRVQTAITRSRYIKVLEWVERRNGVDFKPIPGSNWADSVYMGDEIRNGGGRAIRETLIQHMLAEHEKFHESIAAYTQHTTHMLRDPLRVRRGAPQENPLDRQETIPIESPRGPDYALERSDSLRTLPVESPRPVEAVVINPPAEINGQPNPVTADMELTQRIAEIIQTVYGIPPGYNVQAHIEQLHERVDDIIGTVREILEVVRGNADRA